MGMLERPLSVVYVGAEDHALRVTTRFLEVHGVHVERVDEPTSQRAPDVYLIEARTAAELSAASREIRACSAAPIVAILAQTMTLRVPQSWADHQLTRPFSHDALLHWIVGAVGGSHGARPDGDAADVVFRGRIVRLTAVQRKLLSVLTEHAGHTVSRGDLTATVASAAAHTASRALDVHICRLRQKLGDDPKAPRFIRTVRGVGYVLVPPSA
jgi:DNA-binding response OmpR family regulator